MFWGIVTHEFRSVSCQNEFEELVAKPRELVAVCHDNLCDSSLH
jgi:hypothetical protein